MNKLSDLLKKLRGSESLRDVAKRANISHSYLSHLEKGVDPRTDKPLYPSTEVLKALAKAFNYPYQELYKAAGYLDYDNNNSPLPPPGLVELFNEIEKGFFRVDGNLSDDEKESIIKDLKSYFSVKFPNRK